MTNGGDKTTLFVDTNVLVFATLADSPLQANAQKAIRDSQQAGIEIWISRQIIREYRAALSRPQVFSQPASPSLLRAEVELFILQYNVAEDNAEITERLLHLIEIVPTGGKHIHDANIVATMLTYGITHLLTHNVTDFTRFSQFVTVVSLT